MRILSSSANFSAGRPLLPAYNISATMATTYSTYRLGAVASLKLGVKFSKMLGNAIYFFTIKVFCSFCDYKVVTQQVHALQQGILKTIIV